jgi:hypothetical protein
MFSFNQSTPTQIKVDFNDGQGYQNITADEPISITYQNSGVKTIKGQFHYANNTVLSSHSRIVVDYIDPNVAPRFDGSGRIIRNVTGAPWQGEITSGLVTIELAAGHAALTKPLIVIEGFDPENDFDYFDLIFDLGPGGLNVPINTVSGLTLNQAIENEDYDLVFVNFNNSLDFIQRNVYMVEEVIREVNAAKMLAGSTEKNVVMGISMGGLVARYALRDMEMNGETHDTKLYISHDTPHQGANVPLSIQALVRNLVGEEVALPVLFGMTGIPILDVVDEFEELEDALALLESPAAQQMLIYQAEGTGGTIRHPQGNTLHDDFMTEYQNMGYPQQDNIRNIAISNATDCGTPLDFEPYDVLLDFDESIDDISDFEYFLAGLVDVIGFNPLRGLTSILSTKRDIKAQFKCNALPSQQLERIYNGRIFIQKKLFGFINVNEDLMDRGVFHSSNNMLPLDSANGGIYDMETFATIPAEFANSVLESRFSFIPVCSSLDVGQGNAAIDPSDLVKVYDATTPPVAPKDIPFDNFHANPFISRAHTQFTIENGNWLIDELTETPDVVSCAFACNNAIKKIEGPESSCDTATFSFTSGYDNYFWDADGAAVSITNRYNNETVITRQNGFSGIVSLTLRVNSPKCGVGNTGYSKEIYVGAPHLDNAFTTELDSGTFLSIYPPSLNCDVVGLRIDGVPRYDLVDEVEMRKPATSIAQWDADQRTGRDNKVGIYPDCNELFVFEVRMRNDCGWSEWKEVRYNLDDCNTDCTNGNSGNSGMSENFIISPVPADTDITISFNVNPTWTFTPTQCYTGLTDENGNTLCDYHIVVEMYDLSDLRQIFIKNHLLGTFFDVSGLMPGTYVLKLSHGNQIESHQIVIQ